MNKFLEEGMRLQKLSKYPQAYQEFINAVKYDNRCHEAYHTIGIVLRLEKKYMISISCLKKAVDICPKNPEYHLDLGESYRMGQQWDKAEIHFRESLKLNKNNPRAWYCLAYILTMMGKLDEADIAIKHSIRMEPNIPDLKWLQALIVLFSGDYNLGFKLYESRKALKESTPKSTCPEWTGQDLTGKILYIESEQGFGDVIQFSRFLNIIPKHINFICGVPNELHELMKTSFPNVKFCSWHNPPKEMDYYILTGSMMCKFDWGKTQETLPSTPYISTDKIIEVKKPKGTKKTIGFCWAGSKTHQDDEFRSTTLELFYKNLTGVGIELYSLQLGQKSDPALISNMGLVHDMIPLIKNFSDTAAIIKQLDHIVCVDTSLAHLAGAMGIPVSVMIPSTSVDWRWLVDRTDSPWYSSMKLYRQKHYEPWDDILQRIKKDILDD